VCSGKFNGMPGQPACNARRRGRGEAWGRQVGRYCVVVVGHPPSLVSTPLTTWRREAGGGRREAGGGRREAGGGRREEGEE
jgi:hypothetical protein